MISFIQVLGNVYTKHSQIHVAMRGRKSWPSCERCLSHKLFGDLPSDCRNSNDPPYDVTDLRMLSHPVLGVTHHVQAHTDSIESGTVQNQTHYAAFAKRMQTVFRKTYADTPCHKSNVNTRPTEGMRTSYEDLRFNTILAKSVQTREHMRCTRRVCYHTARSARKCWHTSVQPSIPKLRSQERISVVSHQKMP